MTHLLPIPVLLLAAAVLAADVPSTKPSGESLTSGTYVLKLPLGLQAGSAYIPDDNPLSAEKIELGRLLYFDPRFSKDESLSCASCHNPYHGFADPAATSRGVGVTSAVATARRSSTGCSRRSSSGTGAAADLEEQAKGPLVNPVEMAMGDHGNVVKKCQGIKGYAPLFKKAFGDETITIERIAQAIASYERTVVSGNSPYDRWQAGDKDAISASAVRGMDLFNGKANCKVCHAGFNFTDESYHNLGVGMDKPKPDLGRFEQTKTESDRGAFKTPTLRNVADTPPYMHDGSEIDARARWSSSTTGAA